MPNGPQREPATVSSADDITWLETVLFSQPGQQITKSPRRSSSTANITWAALPARGITRRLVPTSGPFAAEAFTNNHDAMSSTRRAVGRIARTSVRSGALGLGPRLHADANMLFGDPQQSVIAAAADGIGEAVASCAITLGPRRYNRKPVVHLMDGDAKTIGFLKVGADDMTSAMVATEAAAIDRIQRPTSALLEIPQVLWRSEWNGWAVACFSPVGRNHRSIVPADDQRLIQLASAVVDACGGYQDAAVRGCGPVARLRVEANASDQADAASLADRVEAAFGNHTVTLGAWHGDFSPWNMISGATSTALIDWEFASSDMPLGSDLLHHRVMTATHLHGEPATVPVQQLLAFDSDIPELHAMSVTSNQHRPHLLLYLLELIRRDLELGRTGLPLTGFGTTAAAAAEHILAEAENA